MSGPCFSHFQLNCKICFPNGTNANNGNVKAQKNSSQPTKPTDIPAKVINPPAAGSATTTAGSTTGTVATSQAVTSPGTVTTSNTVTTSGALITPGTVTTSTTSGAVSTHQTVTTAGTVVTPQVPTPRTIATSTNSGTVPTAAVKSLPSQPPDDSPSCEEGNKRKESPLRVEFRPIKRKKKAIIDCPVVQHIFRRELKLTNKFFNSGNVLAWVLDPEDEAFRKIHDYVANGQEHQYGIKVCSIIRVVAKASNLDNDILDFNEDPDTRDKFRMTLWHGTKKAVIESILENGLRLPNYNYQMFGPGIYFADRISKSCQYAGFTCPGSKAYLFLCDVLLGNVFECIEARYITSPPKSAQLENDSVRGVGRRIPDPTGNKLCDGSVWPLGVTVENPYQNHRNPLQLNFNEFIVYKTSQVRPKYLIKVEFTEKPYYERLG